MRVVGGGRKGPGLGLMIFFEDWCEAGEGGEDDARAVFCDRVVVVSLTAL